MKRALLAALLLTGCGCPTALDAEYIALNRAYRSTATEIMRRNPAMLSAQEAQLLDDMAASAEVREKRWLGEEAP